MEASHGLGFTVPFKIYTKAIFVGFFSVRFQSGIMMGCFGNCLMVLVGNGAYSPDICLYNLFPYSLCDIPFFPSMLQVPPSPSKEDIDAAFSKVGLVVTLMTELS